MSRATSCLPPTLFGLPMDQTRGEEVGEEGEKRDMSGGSVRSYARERKRIIREPKTKGTNTGF